MTLPAAEGNFDAQNIGGYVRLGYRARNIPVYASLSGYFGDIGGAAPMVGVRL